MILEVDLSLRTEALVVGVCQLVCSRAAVSSHGVAQDPPAALIVEQDLHGKCDGLLCRPIEEAVGAPLVAPAGAHPAGPVGILSRSNVPKNSSGSIPPTKTLHLPTHWHHWPLLGADVKGLNWRHRVVKRCCRSGLPAVLHACLHAKWLDEDPRSRPAQRARLCASHAPLVCSCRLVALLVSLAGSTVTGVVVQCQPVKG